MDDDQVYPYQTPLWELSGKSAWQAECCPEPPAAGIINPKLPRDQRPARRTSSSTGLSRSTGLVGTTPDHGPDTRSKSAPSPLPQDLGPHFGDYGELVFRRAVSNGSGGLMFDDSPAMSPKDAQPLPDDSDDRLAFSLVDDSNDQVRQHGVWGTPPEVIGRTSDSPSEFCCRRAITYLDEDLLPNEWVKTRDCVIGEDSSEIVDSRDEQCDLALQSVNAPTDTFGNCSQMLSSTSIEEEMAQSVASTEGYHREGGHSDVVEQTPDSEQHISDCGNLTPSSSSNATILASEDDAEHVQSDYISEDRNLLDSDEWQFECSSEDWSESESDYSDTTEDTTGPCEAAFIRFFDDYKVPTIGSPSLFANTMIIAAGTPTAYGYTSVTSSNSSIETSSSSAKLPARAGGKRSRDQADEGCDDDDESRDPGKHPKKSKHPSTNSHGSERNLACPYYKHDPCKFFKSGACYGPGWPNVHRVKGHLHKVHAMPPHCIRCYTIFDSVARLKEHSRRVDHCTVRDPISMEGFDADQGLALKDRKPMYRAGSEEQKWRYVYRILFPNTADDDIPSPYYDTYPDGQASLATPKSPEMKLLLNLLRTRLPKKIATMLRTRVEGNSPSIQRVPPSQLENVVIQALETLYRDFVRSVSSPTHASTIEQPTSEEQSCQATTMTSQNLLDTAMSTTVQHPAPFDPSFPSGPESISSVEFSSTYADPSDSTWDYLHHDAQDPFTEFTWADSFSDVSNACHLYQNPGGESSTSSMMYSCFDFVDNLPVHDPGKGKG